MLKLKSIVKTEQQLLATGWEMTDRNGYTNAALEDSGVLPNFMNLSMLHIELDKPILEIGAYKGWNWHPEMVLLVDQWGFVRDPESLEILMFDGARGTAKITKIGSEDFPISVNLVDIGLLDYYAKDGRFNSNHKHPILSKYPYSLTHGGYTPFDFEELKQAFDCPKVLEGEKDDTSPVNDETSDDTSLAEEALDSYLHQPVGPHDTKPPVTLDNPINDSYMTSEVVKKLADSMKYCDNDLKTKISDKIIELLGRI